MADETLTPIEEAVARRIVPGLMAAIRGEALLMASGDAFAIKGLEQQMLTALVRFLTWASAPVNVLAGNKVTMQRAYAWFSEASQTPRTTNSDDDQAQGEG